MALRIGQILKGQHGMHRLVEALKGPTVFKVQVLPCSPIKPGLDGPLHTLRNLYQ